MQAAIPSRASTVRPALPSSNAGPGLPLVVTIASLLAMSFAAAILFEPKVALLGTFAVIGPIIGYYMIARPSLAVSIGLVSHTWAIELAGPYVTPFKIFGVLALLVVARHVFVQGKLRAAPAAYTYGVVTLLTLVAVGELLAEYGGSLSPFFEFGGTMVVFLLLTQAIRVTEDVQVFAKVYTVNLILTAISVAIEVGWAALGEAGTRAVGICGQPNTLANHLAISLPLALAPLFDREERKGWRIVALIAVLGAAYGEWGAASRGGTIGFVSALITFAFVAPRRPSFRLSAVALALATTAIFASLAPKSFARVTETFDGSTELDNATSERSLHARIGAEMVPRHPVFGSGITAFGYERSRYSGVLGGSLHSSVLAVAVAYGLPALVLYVLLQLSAVVAALRVMTADRNRVYLAGLAAAAVAAISSSLSGTELFRAEQWGIISLCHIAALRAQAARPVANRAVVPA